VPRRIITILLMLWFPVQGWAAVAMPMCLHESSPNTRMDGADSPSAVADGPDGHCNHHAPEAPAQSTAQCDDCAACHLAHTPTLTPPPPVLQCAAPAQRAESGLIFYYQLFPEQPQRPPLSFV
jgi:hypothetical protein